MDRRTTSDARSAVVIGSPGSYGERWLVHKAGHSVSVIGGPCRDRRWAVSRMLERDNDTRWKNSMGKMMRRRLVGWMLGMRWSWNGEGPL